MAKRKHRPNRLSALRTLGRMYGERYQGRRVTLNIDRRIGGESPRGITALEIEARLAVQGTIEEINLLIDSPGGSVDEARKIYKLLREYSPWVNAMVTGRCASAAVTVLLAADWREAKPRAQILIHEAEIDITALPAETTGKRWIAARHRAIAELLDKTTREKLELYSKRTSTPIDVLKRELANPDDRSMSLNRALALGFIHAREGETRWIAGRPYA
jgi:ATP-dependent protease ClpP protease subunit